MFCGAGGASIGLWQAGFDVIVGIDNNRNCGKRYPFDFVLADALSPPLDIMDFDFVWASPPCQQFSVGTNCAGIKNMTAAEVEERWPNLVPMTRQLLKEHPYTVIENVRGAPIRADVILSGWTVGLDCIDRIRHFETSFFMLAPPVVLATKEEWRSGKMISVTKSGASKRAIQRRKALGMSAVPKVPERKKKMGIPECYNMTMAEIGESVPPPYAKLIGERVLASL